MTTLQAPEQIPGFESGPSDAPILVATDFPQGVRARHGERLDHLFEERCDWIRDYGRAGRLAVDAGDVTLTYPELDERANRLARYLLGRGARPGDRIALLFDPAVPAYVAMLAVLKINAAYVPLDPGFPPDRIGYILGDAGVHLVLSLTEFRDRVAGLGALAEVCHVDQLAEVIAAQDSSRLTDAERGVPVEDLAYLIYTSGTTGRPKGVAIAHAGICNGVRVAAEVYGLRARDRMYQGMTIAFGVSAQEIWVPWFVGATLVPKPAGTSLRGPGLHAFLSERRVTAMCCVPTLLATVDDDLPDLRFLLVSGEACPQGLVARWHRPGRRFLNVYGPTEATVTATWTELHPDHPVTIGVPLPTYATVILDPQHPQRALPPGEAGEIGIAGIGLVTGYLNCDGLTEKAFIPDFLGISGNTSRRIHRTGDLGRVNADGEIEYLGRIDLQVEIRGHPVQPAAIESVLGQVPGVAQAVVGTHSPEPGTLELVGYYSLRAGHPRLRHDAVYARLRERLPAHAVPAYLEHLEAIPMTSENKVDRRNLPAPAAGRSRRGSAPVADDRDWPGSGGVDIEARDLVVVRDGRRLLDSVGFRLQGRGLLAVLGPSGSGKSTLLKALAGTQPADSGGVRYGGQDFYGNYDELRRRIGLVPQDDILHPQLTVHRALSHAARLRFPPDVPAAARERRICEVLDELGLTAHAQQRIDTLSGGQRKRTSAALELLTRPSLLFLDEPTSGLDPGLDKQVMHNLRTLADGGRTVVVVTHSVLNLDVCDRLLILAPGGRLAYDGPPDRALDHFGVADFAEVFLLLENEPSVDWSDSFRATVRPRTADAELSRAEPPSRARPAPGSASALTQFRVLSRRTVDVILADRAYLLFLALLPVTLSVLARAVPSPDGLSTHAGNYKTVQFLLVLIVSGALMGTASSIRELVKERSIYQRERAVGLSRGAYLAAKLTVLGVLAAVQATIFAALATVGRTGPDGPVLLGSGTLEVGIAVVAVAGASMVLGLAISAAISNSDRGMPLLVLLVMLQFVLCGGLFPIDGRVGLQQLAWLVPARWAFAMGAITIDVGHVPTWSTDRLWQHDATTWVADAVVLGGFTMALIVLVGVLLRRCDPLRRRPGGEPPPPGSGLLATAEQHRKE